MGLTLCSCLRDGHVKNKELFSSTPFGFSLWSVTPPIRLAVLLEKPPAKPGDPRSQWSPVYLSPNLKVCPHRGSVSRAAAEQSSDAVIGAVGISKGLHVWEIQWEEKQRGSHALLGVSTNKSPLQASGYTALIGGDSHSWGWELSTNQLWHDGKKVRQYPSEGQEYFKVPNHVMVVLDADAGTLGYVVENHYLGVAFQGLPKNTTLYLAVSCVWGGATIYMRYMGGMTRDPPSLQSLSRLTVCQALGPDGIRNSSSALERLLENANI